VRKTAVQFIRVEAEPEEEIEIRQIGQRNQHEQLRDILAPAVRSQLSF